MRCNIIVAGFFRLGLDMKKPIIVRLLEGTNVRLTHGSGSVF